MKTKRILTQGQMSALFLRNRGYTFAVPSDTGGWHLPEKGWRTALLESNHIANIANELKGSGRIVRINIAACAKAAGDLLGK